MMGRYIVARVEPNDYCGSPTHPHREKTLECAFCRLSLAPHSFRSASSSILNRSSTTRYLRNLQ